MKNIAVIRVFNEKGLLSLGDMIDICNDILDELQSGKEYEDFEVTNTDLIMSDDIHARVMIVSLRSNYNDKFQIEINRISRRKGLLMENEYFNYIDKIRGERRG